MAIFGPMMLVAVANGINLPNSTTGAISVNSRMTGAASGLSGFLQISTGALATYIVGQLQNDNQWPMVLSMFCSALLALAAYLLVFFSARR
jgi:DHA1 family bicyclomycin/chloramphenicol resistance-like MFS transporter